MEVDHTGMSVIVPLYMSLRLMDRYRFITHLPQTVPIVVQLSRFEHGHNSSNESQLTNFAEWLSNSRNARLICHLIYIQLIKVVLNATDNCSRA